MHIPDPEATHQRASYFIAEPETCFFAKISLPLIRDQCGSTKIGTVSCEIAATIYVLDIGATTEPVATRLMTRRSRILTLCGLRIVTVAVYPELGVERPGRRMGRLVGVDGISVYLRHRSFGSFGVRKRLRVV